MNAEDLTEIERAGRRCGVCHSGRAWRRFEVIRPAEREPVVLCRSCRARFGDDPPIGRRPTSAREPAPAAPDPISPTKPRSANGKTKPASDRLQVALRTMPRVFSTSTAARAAGINKEKTLARLQALERRGEVHRVGNRWSTDPSGDALASAMDRLQAQTSNLRIVRDRAQAS